DFHVTGVQTCALPISAVEKVLYLIFNEGYAATAGPSLTRVDLSREAIRLTRQLHSLIPHDTELTGLLSLMLLTDARRPARTGARSEARRVGRGAQWRG